MYGKKGKIPAQKTPEKETMNAVLDELKKRGLATAPVDINYNIQKSDKDVLNSTNEAELMEARVRLSEEIAGALTKAMRKLIFQASPLSDVFVGPSFFALSLHEAYHSVILMTEGALDKIVWIDQDGESDVTNVNNFVDKIRGFWPSPKTEKNPKGYIPRYSKISRMLPPKQEVKPTSE